MYNAFISYSHAADGKLAPALQNALERFAKPWYKLRNLNIFRDEASLTASPHLWSNIQAALQQSEYLIYMASPASANSRWISKEIEYWLEFKSLDTLLIALTDGEILWDEKTSFFLNADINSLPTVLEKKFTEEPFYIDLRNLRTQKDLSLNNPIFKKEVLKLAAQLHGKEPKDLASEEVSAHNKMMRLRNGAVGLLVVLFFIALWAAWFANTKRIEANKRTVEARESKARAESSARFANLQSRIAREQRDSAILARREADSSAIVANLQADTAQMERDNALLQQQIASREKEIAVANYLLSEAKSASELDPTLGLRIAEAAMKRRNDPAIHAAAYKIYRENSFYKIIGKHRRGITGIAVAPNGKHILSVSKDSVGKISDLNGKMISEFKDPSQIVCAAYSPDGKYTLTGSRDGIARLRDGNHRVIKEFNANSYIEGVAFSPDGRYIVTGSYDSTATLWSIKGNSVKRFTGHKGQVTSVAFSPGGSSILTGSYDGTARLWNLEGATTKVFHHNAMIYAVEFSPDGEYIATGSLDKVARLWNVDGSMVREFTGHSDAVISVAFSPDGKFVLTGSWDNSAALFDLEGDRIEMFKGNTAMVNAVFCNDGEYILTAGGESASMYEGPADHTIRLWKRKGVFREIVSPLPVIAAAVSPDQQVIAIAVADSSVRMMSIDGKIKSTLRGHRANITDVCFSPDGKWIASVSLDSTIRLWTAQGVAHSEITGHDGAIGVVSFSPDGKYILTGSEDETARVWNLSGTQIRSFPHASPVRTATFSPGGDYVLTGTSAYGEVARLWKADGSLIREYHDFTYSLTHVTSLSFSPDGRSFVAGTADYNARLWALDGKLLAEFKGHTGGILSVQFSPDGKTVLTGSKDRTMRLWDLSGNTIHEFRGHVHHISAVCYLKDGRRALSASYDRTVRLWELPVSLKDFLNSNNIESFVLSDRLAGIR